MQDQFGRNIDYMRISVTDKCNLRCQYCMPEDICLLPMSEILTFEEITEVCRIASDFGIRKIKLTGGEPLVRRQVEKLTGMIKNLPGIETVTMTTNGILLKDKIEALKENGLDAVNISLDTLDRAEFASLTGKDQLDLVLEGINAALSAQIPVKINTVHRQDLSDEMILQLAEFVSEKPIHLRFIELMPIGAGKSGKAPDNERILQVLESHYGRPERDPVRYGNGPAVYYHFSGIEKSVGLISAMHGKFCSSCNRIRLSATGQVKPCLCYAASTDLKRPLREGRMDLVRRELEKAICQKPRAHCFEKPEGMTESQRMVSIGG